MELKVWVDGIQRVVCGITEQTTVQEVVIALAQATGRTGRYTLVEQRKGIEKMLPPSEKPLQILAKMGENSHEVQFILRRTGASSVSGSDGVITQNAYRQSLPPQMKHRQKNDALLNRKEPKRKSLSISNMAHDGATKPNSINPAERNLSENNGKENPAIKKALIPPPLRNNTSSNVDPTKQQPLPSPTKVKKDALIPPIFRQDDQQQPGSGKKKALMPPSFRNDASKVNGTPSGEMRAKPPAQSALFRSKTPDRFHHRRTNSSSSNASPVKTRPESAMAMSSSSSKNSSKSSDAIKAREDFTRLVLEQHKHIQEQSQTLKTITEEMEKFEETMESKVKSSASAQKEIELLELKIKQNEADVVNEESLESLLLREEDQNSQLHSESNQMQADIDSVNQQIKEMERKLAFLNEEITREEKRKQQERRFTAKNKQLETQSDIERRTSEVNRITQEVRSVEGRIARTEEESNDKKSRLEALNRELRQVNLQQFIRQTGSKVTVLPPEDVEKATTPRDIDSFYLAPKGNSQRPQPIVGTSSDSGGVWV